MFGLSKIFWGLFNPGVLILLGVGAGVLGGVLPWRSARRLGRAVLLATFAVMLAIAVLPIGPWMILPLEDRFAAPDPMPARADGIIALGGAINLKRSVERGSAQLNEHAERMIAFAELARRYPQARLVFTGGSGSLRDQTHKESDFAPALMAQLGIPPGRLAFERESRNTYENAVFAKRLAEPRPGEVWLLVTSAFHMPRAVGAFRRAGWEVVPYPVDYQSAPPSFLLDLDLTGGLVLMSKALHEWIGLVAYRIFGWSDAVFPGPEAP